MINFATCVVGRDLQDLYTIIYILIESDYSDLGLEYHYSYTDSIMA